MTENFYKTSSNKMNYSTFGGLIYLSDYDTSHTPGNIVQRIITDMNFDKQCKRNSENRDNKKNYQKGK